MEAPIRHDWALHEVRALHDLPLPELVYQAQTVHRLHHAPAELQLCSLLSIKTGGCAEDCKYCPQSAHYQAGVSAERMLAVEQVLTAAREAREAGASRFCMGAAWRQVKDGSAFEAMLDMVRGVRALGLEACVTAGMLTDAQAAALAEAGLTAYNHNLDTSREFYDQIVTTRTYEDRLETIARVQRARIQVCSGGIIGMGETIDDRCAMLATLAAIDPHPESVPINALVPVEGTPLGVRSRVDPIELVRMVATARILLPLSVVRLSAGRAELSDEAQALCFLAGANSIFYGDRLLTTGNPDTEHDRKLLEKTGMHGRTVSRPTAHST